MTLTDKNQTDTAQRPRWGARFKTAREAMNLTEKDVAARLHLKPHLISIIESERFENGPPAIFMRGYIRSYARLLNFSDKETTLALSQLNLATPVTSNPMPAMRTRITPDSNHHVGWSTALVVVVLVGLVGMWWNNHAHNNQKEGAYSTVAQAAQPAASSADQKNNGITAAQAPSDPTPKELLNQPLPAMATPNTATTAENRQSPTPAPTVMADATASNPQIPSAVGQQPPLAANASLNPPTAIESAAAGIIHPATTATQMAENEARLSNHKTIAKNKTPEMTSEDMAVPEQGLESDDSN